MVTNHNFSVVTIYHHKNSSWNSWYFLSNNFFPKSQKGNGFWTFLKMSIFWKPRKVSKIGQKCDCDDNSHNYFFCEKFL